MDLNICINICIKLRMCWYMYIAKYAVITYELVQPTSISPIDLENRLTHKFDPIYLYGASSDSY